ncbi:NDP-sugar synthase [Pontiellaceae bacterium B1224]|nr:NDP-sugar synthase [Pontiellaceae bacterium B1224]
MIAVLNTSLTCKWAKQIGDTSWALLPVANRPLIDYWLETCTGMGIRSVHILLGEGAKEVEDYVRSGDRWNVVVEYVFSRSNETAVDYLKSISNYWKNGLLYFGGPFFMRRRQGFRPDGFKKLQTCCHKFGDVPYFIYGKNGEELSVLIGDCIERNRGLEEIHINPYVMGSIGDYFELNMKMVRAEFSRYVTAGFSGGDGSSLGYNVRTPPSSHLQAPILVGDDCRFGAMTTIGPNAVVANHVIIDAFSELTDCLILDDTYIGRNLEIRNKIVAGNRVIDPSDGTTIEITDSWLIAHNRQDMRTGDVVRYLILWCVALAIALVQVIPFCLLLPLIRISGTARFRKKQYHDPNTGNISLPVFIKQTDRKSVVYRVFRALSLDRFPRILLVLRGRMFLCGQPPMRHPEDDEIIKQLSHYYPGVFCYQDYNSDSDRLVDSLWYAHIRSLYEDLKILVKALVSRFLSAGRKTTMDEK